jgi:phospholipase C
MRISRRTFIGGSAAALAAGGAAASRPVPSAFAAAAGPAALRAPGSLPDPSRAAGTLAADDPWPFDHLVVFMMENHSFDNYLGMLPLRGQPLADGYSFSDGAPTASNPGPSGTVGAFHLATACPGDGVSQAWNATHQEIDGGTMQGFVTANGDDQPMGYWDDTDLPFYYSLANTFTLANRWFCSAPCQTYPNRRFLMAGTAYGNISTDLASLADPPPPNGTIFDQMSAHGIGWRNYFTDLPATAIIPSIIANYPASIVPSTEFLLDCALGKLPAVSFVDPEFGLLGQVGGPLSQVPGLSALGARVSAQGGSEENPQDIQYGEAFAATIIDAVLASPLWPRTLLVWLYDEHGGYYDHVPPPSAVAPDSIPPALAAGDVPGGYNIYGPRVPAVVVSAYAQPHAVSDVVHDHTSVLATIESKWNLPALTYRDANAATLSDFLSPTRTFGASPALTPPANPLLTALSCSSSTGE